MFVLLIAIVENMTEFRPSLCVDACKQGLLICLLKRLKVQERIIPIHQQTLIVHLD